MFIKYFIKTNFIYGLCALLFSLIGILSPIATEQNSPLSSATIEHISGHIIWGMMVGLLSFSIRTMFLSGSFALILDADHIINFFGVDAISRMGHSIPFAILIFFVMTVIYGKKKIILAAVSVAAVFSHISFDTLIGTGSFPLLIPFSNSFYDFDDSYWIAFQGIAGCIILCAWMINKKYYNQSKIIYKK